MTDPHHDGAHLPEGESPRWLDHPRNREKVYWFVVANFAFWVAAGFLPYEHHPYFAFETVPGFAAFYGLVCCIGLVLAAAWMRTFLMRSEDYYDG